MDIEPTRGTRKTTGRAQSTPKTKVSNPKMKASSVRVTPTSQPLSPCENVQALITKRAYELHCERGYRHGYAIDDWIEAEREILNQIPPV